MALRERKIPKTPPPHTLQDGRLASATPYNDGPRVVDLIPSRRSPRGTDVGLPPTRHSAEVTPDEVGGIRPQPEQVPRDLGLSNANAADGRIPWQQWQQSHPERKLPRVILKVREPGT